MTEMRVETDSFGPLEVPADKLWGAQTARSIMNFKIGGKPSPCPSCGRSAWSSRPPRPTWTLGNLEPKLGDAIRSRRAEVVEGKLDDHFPLVVWQTGRARSPT
jgi:fumarate hydratase class II